MFIINKLISPFIVPPGIFILILLATGLWLLYKKKREIGILNTCIACLMWLLSTQPVSDLLLKGLESGLHIPQNPKGDVIILPSHRIYKDAPDLSGIGYPSGEMLNRMFAAIRLQRKLNIPVIVSGGYISESVYKQNWPRAVKRLIGEVGGYPNKIIIENESRNTYENAKNSYLVCQKHNFENPILVTSAYHMKRSVGSFNKFGIRVLPVPTGFKTWKHKKYTWWDFLPKDFGNTQIAIHEYIGLMYYKLFY